MSYLPDEIHLQPLDGQVSDVSPLQEVIADLKALGFIFIDNYAIVEFPGSVLVGMVTKDGSIVTVVQQAHPEQPAHIEMSTYYPEGSSFTVCNFPNTEEQPQNPQHPRIPFPGADARTLLGIMFNARMSGPFLVITARNLRELGERRYREATVYSKVFQDRNTGQDTDEEKLMNGLNKVLSGEMDTTQFLLGEDVNLSEDRIDAIVRWVLANYMTAGDTLEDVEDTDYYFEQEDHSDEEMVSTQSPGQDELEHALTRLDAWWVQHDPELHAELNPGCETEEIQAFEEKLGGYKLPQDIVLMYKWHNGQDDLSLDIGTRHPFLPLQNALLERDIMLEALGDVQWDPSWLPVFSEADEGMFVILSEQRQPYSGLYYYNLQSDPITMHYQSVLGKIHSLLEAYERGILLPLRDQPDDYYEVYYSDMLESIRQKHNPASYPFFRKRDKTYMMFGEY